MLAGLFACADPAPSARPREGGAAAAASPGPVRGGIKVPLPEGWTVLGTKGGVLGAAPPGRSQPLLRIERRARAKEAIPSERELVLGLGSGLRAEVLDRVVEADLAVLVVELTLTVDGGAASGPALLGVRDLGEERFFCSTAPGASLPEVQAAAKACRGVTVVR